MKQFYAYTHAKPDGSVFYVGKGHAKRSHELLTNRNKHHNNIVRKYGAKNIVIEVFPCDSEELAFKLEINLISHFKDAGFLLANKTIGGEGASGRVVDSETRLKLSEKMKGKNLWAGFKDIEAAKEKLRLAGTGRTHSEKTIEKIKKGNTGKVRTAETLERMRLASTGVTPGPQTREKLRVRMLGNKHAAGCHWFNNGITNVMSMTCPDGFKPGRLVAKTNSKALTGNKFTLGTRWYTNGIVNTMKKECPAGFHLGMTMKEIKND